MPGQEKARTPEQRKDDVKKAKAKFARNPGNREHKALSVALDRAGVEW